MARLFFFLKKFSEQQLQKRAGFYQVDVPRFWLWEGDRATWRGIHIREAGNSRKQLRALPISAGASEHIGRAMESRVKFKSHADSSSDHKLGYLRPKGT